MMTPDARLTDSVAVVTGATGGMGSVIALELARRGARVVTVARDAHRVDALRARIEAAAGPGRVDVLEGDLSIRSHVVAAAGQIVHRYPAVHILVNNAGAHFADHRVTDDGIERHVAVNYLAAFGLTELLSDSLRRGRARVVNVASDTVNDTRQLRLPGRRRPATLDAGQLDDLRSLNPVSGFVPFQAYARAKLLGVMAGYDFAQRFAADAVTVNSLHPGIVATDIITDLIPPMLRPFGALIRRSMLTPQQGAATALRLAVDPKLADLTGVYFIQDSIGSTPPVSHDAHAIARLRASSLAYFANG